MSDWSPSQYLKFAEERTRPAYDLLAQVPLREAKCIYDLGCGPGNSTQLLVDAYPEAKIVGIDNSDTMLAKARASIVGASFEFGDLRNWQPQNVPNLLFSNATFQWVPDHLAVFLRLMRILPSGGVLAVQMPDNLNEPSHLEMGATALAGRWAGKLSNANLVRDALHSPQIYYDALNPHCSKFDVWHTIYNHPLRGAEGIVEWVTATGLRPYLDPLDELEKPDFLADYTKRISKAYPANAEGVALLRFPRLLIVAVKS